VKAIGDAKKLFDHVAGILKPLLESGIAPKKCDHWHKLFE